jgi:hypothetical protein
MPYILHIPGEQPHPLRWSGKHHQSSYGSGALLYEEGGTMLDGGIFRHLRDRRGAWLETDKPDLARMALHLTEDEFLAPYGARPASSRS